MRRLDGLLDDELEAYCFTNSVDLSTGTGPDCCAGTVLEEAAAKQARARA